MAKIQKTYPDDIEAKALLCLNQWQLADAVPIADYNAVDKMFGEVLNINPLHPLHHYLSTSGTTRTTKSPQFRRPLRNLLPRNRPYVAYAGAHLLFPSKIHADAAWSQEASARVDHAQMSRNKVMPDQIHNYAHNNQWLVEDLATSDVSEPLSILPKI